MQIGMIGLGQMGASMTRRLMQAGHDCVVHDRWAYAVASLSAQGAVGAASIQALVTQLSRPRAIWLMLPASAVDTVLAQLVPLLDSDDTVIDGGNSHHRDDVRRAQQLTALGLHHVDVGTSGGVAGAERGYSLTIGGEKPIVDRLKPIFSALAPGAEAAVFVPGRIGSPAVAEPGFLHCGPSGAGHFVKMVRNAIECGLMAAYAEGLKILRHANIGLPTQTGGAATTPLRNPEPHRDEANPPEIREITEIWRRSSAIGSWLLGPTAGALPQEPKRPVGDGRAADVGEGRWTLPALLDKGAPTPVLSAALFERLASRGEAEFASQLLCAMRHAFGSHLKKPAEAM